MALEHTTQVCVGVVHLVDGINMWPKRISLVMALMIVTYLTLFVACSSPFDTSASKCWTT